MQIGLVGPQTNAETPRSTEFRASKEGEPLFESTVICNEDCMTSIGSRRRWLTGSSEAMDDQGRNEEAP